MRKNKIITDGKSSNSRLQPFTAYFLLGVVCLLVLFSVNVSAFNWSNGVKSYWSLNETSGTTAYDLLGNLNLTNNNGTVNNATAKIGTSYFFNGTAYLNQTDIGTDIGGNNPFTFSTWAYPNATQSTGSTGYFFQLGDATNPSRALSFNTADNKIHFRGDGADTGGSSSWTAGNWYHIVLVFNGTGDNVYVNGASVINVTGASAIAANPNLRIGWQDIAYLYRGNLDEMMLLNRTLSSSEVLELYNSGMGLGYGLQPGFLSLTGASYNSSLYETETVTELLFQLNITDSFSIYNSVNSTFVYDGTIYPLEQDKEGDEYSFSVSIDTTMGSSNRIFYWYVNATNSTGSYFSNYSYTQTVNPLIFTKCNSTYNTKFLNITFKDESSLARINASIPYSSFEYYLGDGAITKTYTFSNSSNNDYYDFCTNVNRTFYVDPYVQYKQGTDYPQRIWDPEVQTYTNTVTNKILYLLSSIDGIYVTFQVINSADQVISGVLAMAVRTISGEEIIVAQGTTGASGTVTFWLNPDFSHTFSFSKTGYTLYSYDDTPTQTSYTITLGGGTASENSSFQGIDYSIIPITSYLVNDTVYTFGFNMTSSYWDIEEYGFVLRYANGTIIDGGSTGTENTQLTLNFNTTNQTIIYMDYYWMINGNYTNASRFWVILNSENTDWSIKTFFTDLNTYLDSGIFGLDEFGRYLLVFLIIFISSGIVSYKYGLTSPLAVSTIIFGIIFFLDVTVGLIPDIRGIDNLLTYISALVLAVMIFREVQT